MSVPAFYIITPGADPTSADVRLWLGKSGTMVGQLQGETGFQGASSSAEPEDQIRFDLTQVTMPRRNAVVSVEAGEAYRIDHAYPADLGYVTARVVRLAPAETVGLPVPA